MIKNIFVFQHTFHTCSVVKCASMTFVEGNISVILRNFKFFLAAKFPEVPFSFFFFFFFNFFAVKIHTFSVIQNEFP